MSAEDGGAGRQAVIGAFVAGGIALALAAIVLFGNLHPFARTFKAGIVFQDSVAGLAIGAPVTFRGVRIGAVTGIAVHYDPATRTAAIPVMVQLDPQHIVLGPVTSSAPFDLQHLVAQGLRAELNTQSFVTGQSEIDLDFAPGSQATLHPGITDLPEIPTRLSPIQRVRNQLNQLPLRELAENANATLHSLRSLSEKLDQSLPPLIESLRATSDRSAATMGTASEAITRLQTRLDTTLVELNRLLADGSQQVTQRGGELHTVLQSSNQTVLQARDVMADLKGITSERGADRTNIDETLRDLATTAAALRGLAHDVQANPQLLLTGRRP